jgi:hypothetical protein
MPANTQWYYSQGGQQLGPVSEEQLRQMKAAGQVGAADLVWSEGMVDWLPAGQVAQLQGNTAGSPAAPHGGQTVAPVQGQWGGQSAPYPQYGAHPQPGAYPQAGYAQPSYGGYSNAGPSHQTLAIVGFVLSFLVWPVGLIISIIALVNIGNSGNKEGKGFATAGLIIGLVVPVVGCLGFALCGSLGSMR